MKKILVIDDDDLLRNNLKRLLQIKGFECVVADDGTSGFVMIQEEKPDLVICDVMMRKMDGFELLQRIKSEIQHFTTPFIFLTARADVYDRNNGLSIGADDYLAKPFSNVTLMNIIKEKLGL